MESGAEPMGCDFCGTATDDLPDALVVEVSRLGPDPYLFQPPILLTFCSEDHLRRRLSEPLPPFDDPRAIHRESRAKMSAFGVLGVAGATIFVGTWAVGLVAIWKWIWA